MPRYEYQQGGVAEMMTADPRSGHSSTGDMHSLPLAAMAVMGLMANSADAQPRAPTEPAKMLVRQLTGASASARKEPSSTVLEPSQFTKIYPAVGHADFLGRLLRMDQTIVPSPSFYQFQVGEYARSDWTELLSDVSRWQLLPLGWDGEDALAPSSLAVGAARKFAERLRRDGLPRPEHYVSGDGEISFDWNKDGRTASVSFLEDGSVVAYYQPAKGAALVTPEGSSDDLLDDRVFAEGLRSFA